jgi:hypothetical protein
MGADGSCLSISDTHVLRSLGPEVDGQEGRRFVVGSWRDGSYDFGYFGTLDRLDRSRRATSTELKDWVRG